MFFLLQSGNKEVFSWQSLLLDDHDGVFMLEVIFRALVMYLVILVGLRLIDKRGVRQLSVFELVVIIGLRRTKPFLL